jgi:hypothetical protein
MGDRRIIIYTTIVLLFLILRNNKTCTEILNKINIRLLFINKVNFSLLRKYLFSYHFSTNKGVYFYGC